jgi:hypothetical protein
MGLLVFQQQTKVVRSNFAEVDFLSYAPAKKKVTPETQLENCGPTSKFGFILSPAFGFWTALF